MQVLGVDPGSSKSGYCVVDSDTYKISAYGKIENQKMLDIVRNGYYDELAIEWIASYGQAVGATVFDTCKICGRIEQIAIDRGIETDFVLRRQVKKNLLGKASGKDTNDKAIRQALIERFGEGTDGLTYDCWQALGVAITWIDEYKKENEND